MANPKRVRRLVLRVVLLALLAVAALWLVLFFWPHRVSPYRPADPRADLAEVLQKGQLTRADYELLYAQTGLAPTAVDALLARGEEGAAQILAAQAAFYQPQGDSSCVIISPITGEHRYKDADGQFLPNAPLAPLEPGDIMISFSTHSLGWRHGHAGLVVSPEEGITLESVVLGSLSNYMYINHWQAYTTMMVLRPKGADDATRRQVVSFAMDHLYQVPYDLASGVFGDDKFQDPEGDIVAQCSYLPWYAWKSVGYDLDGDGTDVVTPWDLVISEDTEIIQIFGIDPAEFPLEFDKVER